MLGELVRGFQLKDILDILIVAVLIYGIIKLVRETRAGQLVKGLIIFLFAFLVATIFGLSMLSTFLRYVFQSAFIAILVIFQPEIRKALEQVGRSNVGKSLANVVAQKDSTVQREEALGAIDAVASAFVTLQKLKMGALVVFERQTKLGEIIDTGTIVDAKATSPIIGNIFFNKAPLHDGAVVIRDGKVYSAGCILPLTKNDTLSDAVGTRHRAALGMSEESDAIVVVLSEETGQFSIAVSGNLTRNYTKETLKAKLADYLVEKSETTNSTSKKRSIFVRKKEAENEEK